MAAIDMYSQVFTWAAQHVAQFFTPAIAEVVRRQMPGVCGLAVALGYTIGPHIEDTIEIPSSIENFIKLTEHILSPAYGRLLLRSARKFDRLSGVADTASVSDTFIQEHTTAYWVRCIVYALAKHSEDITWLKTYRPDPLPWEKADEQRSAAPCPIVDITLAGDSILEAWGSNATTLDLEATATQAATDDGNPWDPTRLPNLPVYHGTSNQITQVLG